MNRARVDRCQLVNRIVPESIETFQCVHLLENRGCRQVLGYQGHERLGKRATSRPFERAQHLTESDYCLRSCEIPRQYMIRIIRIAHAPKALVQGAISEGVGSQRRKHGASQLRFGDRNEV